MSIKPLNPIVATMTEKLDSNLYEAFEERAAIMEFDAGLDRELAEALALLCILHNHPECLQPLVALEIEHGGDVRYVLTTSLGDSKRRLKTMGGCIIRVLDPVELIRDEFQGNAFLTDIEVF
jgi:hypothetical protein